MKRTPIISGEEILKLIPQRPPIVMVDTFCGIEDNSSYSGLTITSDNIFCQDGRPVSYTHLTLPTICSV